jgi:benzodiazapine receptor
MQSRPGEPPSDSQGPAGPRGKAAQALMLLAFLTASAIVAGLGSLAVTANVNGWFATADMPPWTPPQSVFGPVWTVLYIAMAVAAWLVWRRGAALTSWLPYLSWLIFCATLNAWAAANN